MTGVSQSGKARMKLWGLLMAHTVLDQEVTQGGMRSVCLLQFSTGNEFKPNLQWVEVSSHFYPLKNGSE